MFGITTGFSSLLENPGQIVMILVGLGFIYLAIKKEWEPYELLPIGAGMLLANLPLTGLTTQPEPGLAPGMAGVLGIILKYGLYTWTLLPQFIFFGIGALTDFGPLIANPRAFLLGAAAQIGIYTAFAGAIFLGFTLRESCSIGIIGGADGPTTIYGGSLKQRKSSSLFTPPSSSSCSFLKALPWSACSCWATSSGKAEWSSASLRPLKTRWSISSPSCSCWVLEPPCQRIRFSRPGH